MDCSSDEADDWFMESLNTYKDLHVFQLEHATKGIEWTSDKSICVVGYTDARSEILELLLPLKLYAGDNQGLCAERDFKVLHGGFSEECVECLTHLPGTRCLVTSGRSSSNLQIWDIGGNESDVIKKTGELNCSSTSGNGSKLAAGLTDKPSVLHGSSLNDVQLTEISTGQDLYTAGTECSDSVSGLQFLDACVFLACASNGTLLLADTRDPSTALYPLNEIRRGFRWSFALNSTRSQSEPSSCVAARLSCSGHVLLSDLRDLKTPICEKQLNLPRPDPKADFIVVSWAPVIKNCLSVSGFGGAVHIYDTTSWSREDHNPLPIFSHKGHTMSDEARFNDSQPVVTSHAWHQSRPNTVLSADTDGAVHVWDWVDQK